MDVSQRSRRKVQWIFRFPCFLSDEARALWRKGHRLAIAGDNLSAGFAKAQEFKDVNLEPPKDVAAWILQSEEHDEEKGDKQDAEEDEEEDDEENRDADL